MFLSGLTSTKNKEILKEFTASEPLSSDNPILCPNDI